MDKPRYERLSQALCEAVEFGYPTKIRLGFGDRDALFASITAPQMHRVDLQTEQYEGVPLSVERDFAGCVVEHDNRYTAPSVIDAMLAVPNTAVRMRDTRKPAIVAW